MSKPSLLWDFDFTSKSCSHSQAAARATNRMVKLTETFSFVFFSLPLIVTIWIVTFEQRSRMKKTPLSSGRESGCRTRATILAPLARQLKSHNKFFSDVHRRLHGNWQPVSESLTVIRPLGRSNILIPFSLYYIGFWVFNTNQPKANS